MIADLIHKVARDMQPPMQEYRPRPSGWGRCIRASVYHALGFPGKLFPGRTVVLLEDSGFAEDMTIDWIQRTAYTVHSQQLEVKICTTKRSAEIKGSIDGILQDLTGKEYLLEHKAINHFSFERLEASLQDGIWDENLVKWIHQGSCYLVGLAKLSTINQVVFLVKNKNTSAYLEAIGNYNKVQDRFTLTSAYSTRVIEESETGIRGDLRGGLEPMLLDNVIGGFLGYFNKVEELAATRLLPARPYEISDWHCGYCQWQGTCWEGFEDEIRKMVEGVDLPEDLRPHAEAYLKFRDIQNEAESQKDIERSIILNELQAREIRKCKPWNGISVTMRTEERTTIDKELVPPHILKAAEKKSVILKLDVRKKKEAKNG